MKTKVLKIGLWILASLIPFVDVTVRGDQNFGPHSFYEVVGVQKSASQEQIEAAYKAKLASLTEFQKNSSHPSFKDLAVRAQEAQSRLHLAFSVLSNPEARELYNEKVLKLQKIQNILETGSTYKKLTENEKRQVIVDAYVGMNPNSTVDDVVGPTTDLGSRTREEQRKVISESAMAKDPGAMLKAFEAREVKVGPNDYVARLGVTPYGVATRFGLDAAHFVIYAALQHAIWHAKSINDPSIWYSIHDMLLDPAQFGNILVFSMGSAAMQGKIQNFVRNGPRWMVKNPEIAKAFMRNGSMMFGHLAGQYFDKYWMNEHRQRMVPLWVEYGHIREKIDQLLDQKDGILMGQKAATVDDGKVDLTIIGDLDVKIAALREVKSQARMMMMSELFLMGVEANKSYVADYKHLVTSSLRLMMTATTLSFLEGKAHIGFKNAAAQAMPVLSQLSEATKTSLLRFPMMRKLVESNVAKAIGSETGIISKGIMINKYFKAGELITEATFNQKVASKLALGTTALLGPSKGIGIILFLSWDMLLNQYLIPTIHQTFTLENQLLVPLKKLKEFWWAFKDPSKEKYFPYSKVGNLLRSYDRLWKIFRTDIILKDVNEATMRWEARIMTQNAGFNQMRSYTEWFIKGGKPEDPSFLSNGGGQPWHADPKGSPETFSKEYTEAWLRVKGMNEHQMLSFLTNEVYNHNLEEEKSKKIRTESMKQLVEEAFDSATMPLYMKLFISEKDVPFNIEDSLVKEIQLLQELSKTFFQPENIHSLLEIDLLNISKLQISRGDVNGVKTLAEALSKLTGRQYLCPGPLTDAQQRGAIMALEMARGIARPLAELLLVDLEKQQLMEVASSSRVRRPTNLNYILNLIDLKVDGDYPEEMIDGNFVGPKEEKFTPKIPTDLAKGCLVPMDSHSKDSPTRNPMDEFNDHLIGNKKGVKASSSDESCKTGLCPKVRK